MENPIITDLSWRKTTKKYDSSKQVPQEDRQILFEAIRLSASSINSQPWKFVVVESEEGKKRLNSTFTPKFQFNQPHIFESCFTILFAHHPSYKRENYAAVVDKAIEDKRIKPEDREGAFGGFVFAEMNTDSKGNTGIWTKAQTYLALGNTLHTLARLKIDSTTMEGIDTEMINKEFKKELGDYHCDVALAVGYHHEQEDYNFKLPKSRLSLDSIFTHC